MSKLQHTTDKQLRETLADAARDVATQPQPAPTPDQQREWMRRLDTDPDDTGALMRKLTQLAEDILARELAGGYNCAITPWDAQTRLMEFANAVVGGSNR